MSIPELDVPFTFNRRAMPVPADLRPEWRIGLVLLMLRRGSRGGKSSYARLHVMNWALQGRAGQAQLRQVLDGVIPPDVLYVRFDPALNRAVDLATGEGLLRHVGGDRLELTGPGEIAADAIVGTDSLLTNEQKSLSEFHGRVTEALVRQLFKANRGV